jgi:uncharacterized protein
MFRAFATLAAFLLIASWQAPAVAQPALALAPGEALLSVEATGVSRTRPDVMTMRAGTVTVAETAAAAVAANAALAQRVVAAIRATGVADADVRTAGFRVRPQFEGAQDSEDYGRVAADGRSLRIRGYVVENSFEVRLRNLANAQRLITRLFEAGANRVEGPYFSLADDRAARRAAERDAIEQAREQAENYAAAVRRRLDRVLRISNRRTFTETGAEEISLQQANVPETPVEPGELETRATVFVDFALAPQ